MRCTPHLASTTHAPFTPRASCSRAVSPPPSRPSTLSRSRSLRERPYRLSSDSPTSPASLTFPTPPAKPTLAALRSRFRAASGDIDLVTHSFNGFPVATSDEFAVFLRAIGASGPGVAHPTPIEQFLDRHPIAKNFVTSQPPPPESYATRGYFGVNSFKFTNGSGAIRIRALSSRAACGRALPHRRRREDEGTELSARRRFGSA